MQKLWFSAFFALFLLANNAECARILGVFPAPGYSQFILANKLMHALVKRGHQVTLISSHKSQIQHENYKTICTKEIIDQVKDGDLFLKNGASVFENIWEVYKLGYFFSEATLKNEQVHALIHSPNATFDLVIVEQFFSESLTAFAPHFNAPLVLLSSIGASDWNSHLMGNPSLPSISPNIFLPYSRHMNFIERVHNIIVSTLDYAYRTKIAFPFHETLAKKYFPRDLNFYNTIYNASLMLLNSHVTTSESVPLTQNMVEVGGYYIDPKPLRQDIQDFLDKSSEGVILFSLGTNLNVRNVQQGVLNVLMQTFNKLPLKIMWKTEIELPEKPPNVFTWSWLEQGDILAHPNIRLFITHGGLLSTTEAVFHGVPIVGIPIFGDQHANVARAVRAGIGVSLPYNGLNEEMLYSAISEVLNNSKYRETVRKMSNFMRDTPIRPMDLAMFSIEKVLRQKHVHLIPAGNNLYWFQLYSIDILAFVIGVIVIIVVALRCAVNKYFVNNQIKNKPKLN